MLNSSWDTSQFHNIRKLEKIKKIHWGWFTLASFTHSASGHVSQSNETGRESDIYVIGESCKVPYQAERFKANSWGVPRFLFLLSFALSLVFSCPRELSRRPRSYQRRLCKSWLPLAFGSLFVVFGFRNWRRRERERERGVSTPLRLCRRNSNRRSNKPGLFQGGFILPVLEDFVGIWIQRWRSVFGFFSHAE